MPAGELNSEVVSLLEGGSNEEIVAGNGVKKYFLPGESFKCWSNYGNALLQTPQRFKERALSRADEKKEAEEIRKRSENDMRRTLNWWDLTWFGFGAVIGTGIFVLTGQEAHEDAGPAIVISYALSGFSAMLSVFCYTEFAVEIPVAGGSFAYLRVELGDLAAFIAAGNIILESIVGAAAVARSWTSYFATLLNHSPDDFRIHTNLASGFNLLDPIAVAVLLLASVAAIVSTRFASYLNWIASAVNTLVILFIIIAGFMNANTFNLSPFFPYGVKGVFRAAAVVYFAYTGFDAIATMAEETKNPSRDIPLGLLGSMSAITVIYCLMALVLVLMQSYIDLDVNAAYSLAFQSIGWKWAKYLVALGALKGITTVLLVGAVGQARYTTHIARTHMIPPWFGLVNEKTGTPINATASMAIATSLVAFFSSLDVLSNLLSISTLFIFMLMSVALLVRRHYVKEKTSRKHVFLLTTFIIIIICSSAATAAYWAVSSGWIGYCITLPVWFLATVGLAVFVPQCREAKVWGVPLVPWLPSLSICINLFLMGSLDYMSFIRFGICTVIMLVYYVFLGLHASFDASHVVGVT
ncbi:hypothetical protein SUGI_0082040 [Cryptomeria japonica]|uniref:cationic amino acid transporter 5 n=1 Tax=Cryptomeria japonica TaxID=3369 RepID=UPI002408CBC0|nr:cationic amino acid transporter 5 [Cryptomeria japonica]GLJ08142.1 hypothetical protein SUGI_0082040 [Cryptomeria japonica]